MQFTIEREALLKPLQLVSGVVERRQTIPILSNTLMTVQAQQLSLLATDLEVELIGRVALSQSATPGSITVAARKLMDICRSLPEGALLNFLMKENTLEIRSGRSRFTLTTLPVSDFPNFDDSPAVSEFTINPADLRHLMEKTYFAMAQQDVRSYLNGMLLEIKREFIRTVATDGHRLAMSVVPAKNEIDTLQVIIPRKAITELQRLVGEGDHPASVHVGTQHLRVTTAEYTFTTKLVEGRFPDYDKVIPRSGDKVLTVDRDDFRQALSRAAILANERNRGVCLQLRQDKLQIAANNSVQELAEDEIAVDYQGEEMDISFNVVYLTDILNIITSGPVRMTFSNPRQSALIESTTDSSSLYVAMPMLI